MTSARRLIAAVSLAAGAAALAAPAAQAAPVPAPDAGKLSVLSTVDDLATSGMPEEQRAQMPTMERQLSGLNQVHELNQLHQLTDLVAPVTNALPAVQ
ncbi:hypothetical protein [Streptomyces sp. KL118A]|uniref:hypothetical protein n=1 Tax=Streptomyces sp. KL118A TaxID=3045153 RepID=UPI00278C0A1B|nr:hypothetical protein [Streptomyces sp. KL118A]